MTRLHVYKSLPLSSSDRIEAIASTYALPQKAVMLTVFDEELKVHGIKHVSYITHNEYMLSPPLLINVNGLHIGSE